MFRFERQIILNFAIRRRKPNGDDAKHSAVYQQPIYNRFKDSTPMKTRDLTDTIEKVRKLLELTQRTGFQTGRSICKLLADLSPDELVEVSTALNLPQQR
jgi:hypothetical protein